MNWRKIGNDFVNKLVEHAYEPFGWRCEKAGAIVRWIPKRDPFSKRQLFADGKPVLMPMTAKEDLFGAFDLVCVSWKWPVTLWVQATVGGSQAISTRRDKLEAVAGNFNPVGNRLLLLSRDQVNKQLVRQQVYDHTEKKWGDLRELNFRSDLSGLRQSVEAAVAEWNPGNSRPPQSV